MGRRGIGLPMVQKMRMGMFPINVLTTSEANDEVMSAFKSITVSLKRNVNFSKINRGRRIRKIVIVFFVRKFKTINGRCRRIWRRRQRWIRFVGRKNIKRGINRRRRE